MKYEPEIVLAWFREHGLLAQPEFKFHPSRKWRFDFAFLPHQVALEVDGAVFTGGRHTRGSGFIKDMEKFNEAAKLGWRILRCVPKDLCTTDTIRLIKDAIGYNADAIDFLQETGIEL